jgi:hypothetical protein
VLAASDEAFEIECLISLGLSLQLFLPIRAHTQERPERETAEQRRARAQLAGPSSAPAQRGESARESARELQGGGDEQDSDRERQRDRRDRRQHDAAQCEPAAIRVDLNQRADQREELCDVLVDRVRALLRACTIAALALFGGPRAA